MKNNTFILFTLLLYITACSTNETEETIDILSQEPIISAKESIKGIATKISDGDTFYFEWIEEKDGKSTEKSGYVRSYGIDAPELKQDYGKTAKEFLSKNILDKEITVFIKGIDQYDRLLGIVYLSGEDINLNTIKAGYAWHYKKYDNTPSYAEAEKNARKERKGLWNSENQTPPWEWRKRHYNYNMDFVYLN